MIQCGEKHVLKGVTIKGKNMLCMLSIGSIFFSLRVAPMRIENNFKMHEIEKAPKLNYVNISSCKITKF